MKDIITGINESKQDLCPEVQNEFDKDYAYQTFKIDKSDKYQYGFLAYDKDNEIYIVIGLNEDSKYAESFAGDYNLDAEELFDLKIGESIAHKNHGSNYVYSIIRIW